MFRLLIIYLIQTAFFIFCYFRNKRTNAKISTKKIFLHALIPTFLFYASIVLITQVFGLYLDARLDSFDLDGNGFFSGEEITPEQEAAMSAVTNDTARTLAPVTGLFVSFFHYFVSVVILAIINHLNHNCSNWKNNE